MKKSLIFIIAAVVVAAAVGATIYFTSGAYEEKAAIKQRESIEDIFVAYANLDQLTVKGAFQKHITPENRRLFASMAKAALENVAMSEHLAAIVEDLNNTGMDFTKPLYTYMEDVEGVVFIASVCDIEKLDKSVELISYALEEEGEEPIDVARKGNTRLFEFEEFTFGYNATNIVAYIPVEYDYEEDTYEAVEKALERSTDDFSIFGRSDVAAYVNVEELVSFVVGHVEDQLEYYRAEMAEDPDFAFYYESEIASLEQSLTVLKQYEENFKDNANIVTTLTFDPGRVRLNMNVDFGEEAMSSYEELYARTSNDHLAYLSSDVLFVANASLDGEKLAAVLNTTLNNEKVKELLSDGIDTNEFNMAMAIAMDAMKSINGDVTIAVNDLYGKMAEKHDYYFDYYYSEPEIEGVDAAIIMDVKDKYIISNVSQFAAGFLTKEADDYYSMSYGAFDFTLCQQDNMLFAGVNMTPEEQSRSAVERPWAEEVKNSHSYVVFDVDNIMNCEFMKSFNEYAKDEIDYEYRDLYSKATEMFSYVYVVNNDITTSEVGVVFDDKRTNSLEQLVDLLLPLLTKEMSNELF